MYRTAFMNDTHVHGCIVIEARTLAKPNRFGDGEAVWKPKILVGKKKLKQNTSCRCMINELLLHSENNFSIFTPHSLHALDGITYIYKFAI